MSSGVGDPENDRRQVQVCLNGDSSALENLRAAHHSHLERILRARGATADEVEELLAGLWADCVPRETDSPTLLEKYSGRCPLQSWLATVATRRWIDLKRKQARRKEADSRTEGDEALDPLDGLPAPSSAPQEDVVIGLLQESLEEAFAACGPADMLMLRLVHLHGLSQREVMRMWGWSESKVSRQLSRAMEGIRQRTLATIRQKDPLLDLTWEDFVSLCEAHRVGFL